MNAKFLERFITYRENHGIDIAKTILSQKIKYQFSILNQRKSADSFLREISSTKEMQNILLVEARAARSYWSKFHISLNDKAEWSGRMPHQKDAVNKLLDIGYHSLAQRIFDICEAIRLPTELGIFHKAQSAKARPLVYDFMEIMRPIMVDDVLLKMLHKKKRPIEEINEMIPSFVYRIKKKGKTLYFHKELGYCITLDYWMRLLLLGFMGAVYTDNAYHPIFPSIRHESRCKEKAAFQEAAGKTV
jgi:CRISPR-associated endonuclease Cas1